VHRHLSPAPILADPRWLHQVITNLLTNAIKYTPPGGHLTITTAPAGPHATLTVTDTGPGIDPADLPRIFDRFWRSPRTAHTSGTGLGLAIAAELTHAHGGQLTATSQPGHGTQITLTLPRLPAASAGVTSLETGSARPEKSKELST
jgi:two-component system, OmpR family, sensor histidine kinase BaeS